MNCAVCHVEPFGDVHDGTSLEAVFSCHHHQHGDQLKLLAFCEILLPGLVVGASLSEASPIPSFAQTGMPNFYLVFPPSFDHNFGTNDNQTFNVCAESTLVLYRKGLCDSFRERSATSFKDQRKY